MAFVSESKSAIYNCNNKNNKYNLDCCTTNVCLPPTKRNFDSTYNKKFIFSFFLIFTNGSIYFNLLSF